MMAMVDGLRLLWAKKWSYGLIFCMLTLGTGMAIWFLWLPVANGFDLALHGCAAVGAAGLWLGGLAHMRRRFMPEKFSMMRALRRGPFWIALAVFAVSGVWLPYRLMWWIPEFETIERQAASAAVRFLLAWVLLTGGIVWLAVCAGLLSREEASGAEGV